MSISLSLAEAQVAAAAIASDIGAGSILEIRSGAKPATPETAATGTLLVSVTVGTYTASGGVLSSADPASVSPTAGGVAGYFRVKKSGGTAVLDGTVTATGGGGDMELGNTTIQTGVPVDLGVVSFTVPGV